MAKDKQVVTRLSDHLVLNKFILRLFGCTDLQALSENLRDPALEGWDENGVSLIYHQLVQKLYSNKELPSSMLLEFDQNIASHTLRISEKRNEPIKWKYFQYMALLFTEIYFDRYFSNPDKLALDINDHKNNLRADGSVKLDGRYKSDGLKHSPISDFTIEELNKLAYWNATGSGKTLLMHINILQYQHYLRKHGKERYLNRIIVLTPNEGLSNQHLAELKDSGFDAELFSKSSGGLYQGTKIEIIDIHKLEEKSGNKTVAIESFEGNNLVLVDEGHRGSGGEVWKDKRNRLCEGGFSFEYSATFGQAVSAFSDKKKNALLEEYAKATIFDYSYKYFYADGYGKDYQVLNINDTWNKEFTSLYLTACLLAFYEQVEVFGSNRSSIAPFQIEKPLAIFVGKNVTASQKKGVEEQASDVIQILSFLADFVKNANGQAVENLKRLLNGTDGLTDKMGKSIFRNSFVFLKRRRLDAAALFSSILGSVFNSQTAGALLHLDNLKGQDGEIGVRVGDADYFGVINVGDGSKLLDLCEKAGINTSTKDFTSSLFKSINHANSTVTVLIGSKKFSEGWSSWRVSTMGLMNIGQGEGSEIIQLFGRGVRLKGYQTSLKRSSALDYSIKPANIPEYLPLLETLNIFGIKADYMQKFKEYLEEEGLNPDKDTVDFTFQVLPTITDLGSKQLKYLKVREGFNFKRDNVVSDLSWNEYGKVLVDWYPKVDILNSSWKKNGSGAGQPVVFEENKLAPEHLAFVDWDKLFFDLERHKAERSWHNLTLTKEAIVTALTSATEWYTLRIPAAEIEFTGFEKVRMWQEIATALMKGYVDRVYNHYKAAYYSKHVELVVLDKEHPNFIEEYRVQVSASEKALIAKIEELQEQIKSGKFEDFEFRKNFEYLVNQHHLYYPLFYMNHKEFSEIVQIKPTQLNKGERDLLADLSSFYGNNKDFFHGKEVYLLRNSSKKGIGFFEANNFYPDFILWLVDGETQHVIFIDPKGLRQVNGLDNPKLKFNATIRTEIQPRIKGNGVELHSFIVSNTTYQEIKHWKGQDGIEDFNALGVYFQNEQKATYIKAILDAAMAVVPQPQTPQPPNSSSQSSASVHVV